MSEYDISRMEPISDNNIFWFLCGESARVMLLYDYFHLIWYFWRFNSFSFLLGKEIGDLKTALETSKKDNARFEEELKDKNRYKDLYTREIASGSHFLKSNVGTIYIESVKNDFR